MEENKLFNFVINFFKNLGSEISGNKDLIVISNVSKEFESFLGLKPPYYLVFSKEDIKEGYELVSQGSYFLKKIMEYLEEQSTSTLLELDFDFNKSKEIKKAYNFPNAQISLLKQSHKNKFFSRFTFQTSFNYLSKTTKSINEVFVHDGNVIKGNLEGYKVKKGKKEDLDEKEIEKNYNCAKESLRSILNPKIKEISKNLKISLEKEINDLKAHFSKVSYEINEEIKKERKRLEYLEKCYLKIKSEEIKEKIIKSRKNLEKLENSEELKRIKQEQDFTINDLKQKHSLNINNKLINTTIIYYPLYIFEIKVFKKDSSYYSIISIEIDPLTKESKNIECKKCKKQINKIYLCSKSHIVCEDCISKCISCGRDFCKDCLTKKCDFCSVKLCSDCATKCSECGKYFCKTHILTDSVTKEKVCVNCIKLCPSCNQHTSKKFFKKDSLGNLICQKCLNKNIAKEVIKDLNK